MSQVLPALVATLSAQILLTMSVGTGAVLAPLAAIDIGVSPELIGAYMGLVYCMAATVGVISGGFVVRFGSIRVTQTSLLLIALALGIGVAGVPLAAVACALLLGIANGPTTP